MSCFVRFLRFIQQAGCSTPSPFAAARGGASVNLFPGLKERQSMAEDNYLEPEDIKIATHLHDELMLAFVERVELLAAEHELSMQEKDINKRINALKGLSEIKQWEEAEDE